MDKNTGTKAEGYEIWEPSEYDLAWCKMLVGMINSQGTWGTSIGLYKVNHEAKTIELNVLFPSWKAHFQIHERIIIAFEKIGWTVQCKESIQSIIDEGKEVAWDDIEEDRIDEDISQR